ncbi:hypothetical protein M8009_02935 [Halomonas sp. ATCH28]|uniref:Uncharacterized protein n=1 Tax=Halomonas gemina TaxID=2945105 RepID=A0ABT0SYR2_9GAMM|nr:hypothetical protein [Halomonas gemina]MCL7939260.1 hypothetical protein [Halomonas gemina]
MKLAQNSIDRLIAGVEAAGRDFIAGNDEFTFNLALVEDGVPVLCLVHAPALAAGYGNR